MEATLSSDPPKKPRRSKSRDAEVRERLYRAVSNEVREIIAEKEKTAPFVQINKALGQQVYEAITEIIFTLAIKEGYLRFPDGHGSLRVARLTRLTKPKHLPLGGQVQMPPNRMKLRYEQGAAVREALGMPPQTSYVRQFDRRSKLSEKTRALLEPTPPV